MTSRGKVFSLVPDASKPLISSEGGIYVMVSHSELDDLIGKMMMMFELNGDLEQRNALKQEFKWKAREWLDDVYYSSGYRNHEVTSDARVVDISKN